jgi:hypothetical protein
VPEICDRLNQAGVWQWFNERGAFGVLACAHCIRKFLPLITDLACSCSSVIEPTLGTLFASAKSRNLIQPVVTVARSTNLQATFGITSTNHGVKVFLAGPCRLKRPLACPFTINLVCCVPVLRQLSGHQALSRCGGTCRSIEFSPGFSLKPTSSY